LEACATPETERAWFLGLWELRDPGNMGTMIRTAHAFAAGAVVAVGNCVDFYDPKVVRASAGSVLHLPLLRLPNFYALRERLGKGSAALVVADMTGAVPCDQADYPARALLLIGSEAHGLPEEIRAAADLRVNIPMPGGVESLNAGVAAGILAFQLARRRPAEGAAAEPEAPKIPMIRYQGS
jgi:TrmH family RNA methyltransferase